MKEGQAADHWTCDVISTFNVLVQGSQGRMLEWYEADHLTCDVISNLSTLSCLNDVCLLLLLLFVEMKWECHFHLSLPTDMGYCSLVSWAVGGAACSQE